MQSALMIVRSGSGRRDELPPGRFGCLMIFVLEAADEKKKDKKSEKKSGRRMMVEMKVKMRKIDEKEKEKGK